MEFIDNLTSSTHLKRISKLISESNKIIICSGWLKYNGLKLLSKHIASAISRGANVTIVSNIKHTETRCIKYFKKRKINLILVDEKTDRYFHTKLYYFEKNNIYTFIIGSANITAGALVSNDELSISIDGIIGDTNHHKINPYLTHLETEYGLTKT